MHSLVRRASAAPALAATLLAALLLQACTSAQRKGDEAAALGRWGDAVAGYEEAVRDDPKSLELQGKLQNARRQAASAESKRSQGCATQGDYDCALSAIDSALRYTPDEPALLSQRKEVVEYAINKHQGAARDAAAHNLFPAAFREMGIALKLCQDPELAAALRKLQDGFVEQAVALAQRNVAAQAWPEAIALLEEAAKADPSRRALLDDVRGQYDRILQQRAEAIAQQGDDALYNFDWPAAEQRYREALAVHGGGRAQLLLQVAASANAAQIAASRGDLAGALSNVGSALGGTSDERLRPRLESMKSEYLGDALTKAEQLRYQNAWPEALALYDAAAAADPNQSGRAAEARQEYQRYQERLAAERARQAEELSRRGDAALARHDYRGAEDAYRAALQKVPGGRPERMANYAHHMAEADAQQKTGNAASAYFEWKAAVETGADDGTAAQLMNQPAMAGQRQGQGQPGGQPPSGPPSAGPPPPPPPHLNPRGGSATPPMPWTLSLRGLRVSRTKADGTPLFQPLARPLVGAMQREQQPRPVIELALPDGRVLRTPAREGGVTQFNSEVVLLAGPLEPGVIQLRVLHEGKVLMGAVSVSLRDLVNKRTVKVGGQAIEELELAAVATPARRVGELRELAAP
jgi:tetratricopeptide (TPR) repeat protein